jgi:hypothetical protein
MKSLSKKFIVPVLGVAVIGAGLYGVAQVSAESSSTQPKSLVQDIADAFHLDKSKVQAVFDSHRSKKHVLHESKYESRLDQAVADGKLTVAQKEAILAEHKKLEAEMKATFGQGDDSKADRKAAMDRIHQEALDWAKQNNIDIKWVMPGRGHGMKLHGGAPGGMLPQER